MKETEIRKEGGPWNRRRRGWRLGKIQGIQPRYFWRECVGFGMREYVVVVVAIA